MKPWSENSLETPPASLQFISNHVSSRVDITRVLLTNYKEKSSML